MSTSISPLNKGNIVMFRNSTNNSDYDRDSGNDRSGEGGSVNEGFNKDYGKNDTYTR